MAAGGRMGRGERDGQTLAEAAGGGGPPAGGGEGRGGGGGGEREGQTRAEAAEGVVRLLRGVKAVRVESDDAGGIRIVHVLGGPERSAKVIAVDVVSSLALELGVE